MIFATLFLPCAVSPFFLVKDCPYSFTATVVNHQYWIDGVICCFVHVYVFHRNVWHVLLLLYRWHYACELGFVSWLARRSGTSPCEASGSRSVCCILLGSPSQVLSAHMHPRSPPRCLSTCATVLLHFLSDAPALPPAHHARSARLL